MFPPVVLPLTIQEVYDESFYRANYPELANLNTREVERHLLSTGIPQGLRYSPFFDVSYYRSNNPSLSNLDNAGLLNHFLGTGVAERRKSSAYIDLDFYQASNPDLVELDNAQLFVHLKNLGLAEGRSFSPAFDLNSFRASNSNFAGLDNQQLFEQFQLSGISVVPSRNLPQLFDVEFYRSANPQFAQDADLTDDGGITDAELVEHFQTTGLAQGLRFSPFFDVQYYLENNPDLIGPFGNNGYSQALDHFQQRGVNEGRPFSQFFDVKYYLDNNHDLRATGMNFRQAFDHFQNFGVNEGRRPSLLYNPVYYLANNPDLFAQQYTFTEAFEHFQLNGFREARTASILYNPDDIAPLLQPPLGTELDDPILIPDWLEQVAKWGDIPANGTLTYSFVTTASAFLYEGTETGVQEVSDGIKNNVRGIIKQYDDVIGINLVEVPDRPPNVGRIRIMLSNGPADRGTGGYGNQPSDSPGNGIAGDIHLGTGINFGAGPGTYGYQALLFLVGAALGLDDYTVRKTEAQGGLVTGDTPFGPIVPFGKDNNTNTIMSKTTVPGRYNGRFASTPMSYDIRALQYLYGGSYVNNGDTFHRLDGSNILQKRTIWDSGGVDTLDFAGLPVLEPQNRINNFDYYFDMNEGGHNTTQVALNGATYSIPNPGGTTEAPLPPTILRTDDYGTIIAFGSEIENLLGSEGNDEILGNNLLNNITGNGGDDRITGSAGKDTLTGGSGADTFVFAAGDGSRNLPDADVIIDFQDGVDRIGLALALPFGALSIIQGSGANANDTLLRIASSGEYLAVLTGVPVGAINSADFISV